MSAWRLKGRNSFFVCVGVACGAAAMLVTVLGSNPVRAAFPGADGKIVFVADHNIETINPSGGGRTIIRTLSTTQGFPKTPVWSPDGTRIAYATNSGGIESTPPPDPNSIWTMNADGSGAQRIVSNASDPAWSADGRRIAYIGPGSNLFTANADGTDQRQLTSELQMHFDSNPEWSPDGRQIAFVRGPPGDYQITVVNPDGSELTTLTATPGGKLSPAWSSDGRRIAFVMQSCNGTTNDPDMFVMNRDGSGLTRLPDNGVDEGSVAWSPRGARLVFADEPRCGESGTTNIQEIFISGADGTSPRNLTNTSNVSETDPDWQPIRPPSRTPPPTLTVDPGLGPPGFVATAVGRGFPRNANVRLAWTPGLGSFVARSDGAGSFRWPALIFHHDLLGPRLLIAPDFPRVAGAPFLVVAAAIQPPRFVVRR